MTKKKDIKLEKEEEVVETEAVEETTLAKNSETAVEVETTEVTTETDSEDAISTEEVEVTSTRPRISRRNLIIAGVVFFIVFLAIALPLGYLAALRHNLFGINEGTLEVSINVNGQNQSEFHDTITLSVNGEEVELSENLAYTKKIPAGEVDLKISGNYYTNDTATITITRGEITSYTFNLQPTASLSIKALDFFSGEELTDFTVNVDGEEYTSGEASEIIVNDILMQSPDIETIVLSKDGYNSKTFEFNQELTQGLNDFHNVLTKEGKFFYVSNSDGSSSIYSANYDGSDIKKLTDNAGNDYNPELNVVENRVYFLSNRANEKNSLGQTAQYLYSIGTDGQGLRRETTGNYNDYSSIGEYNIYSKLRIFVKYEPSEGRSYLYVGSVKGDGATKVDTDIEGQLRYYKLSYNGKFIVYHQAFNEMSDDEVQKVFYYDLATKKSTEIFEIFKNEWMYIEDVSSDNKYALIYVNDRNGEVNIWRAGIGDKKKLTNDKNYQGAARFLPNSDKFSYNMDIDGVRSVYTRNIDGTGEQKWTGNKKIDAYVWVDAETLLFNTSEGVFITRNASEAKKVLPGVEGSTFPVVIGTH